MKRIFILFCIGLVLFVACKSQKRFSETTNKIEPQKAYIKFGFGGGFANSTTCYTLYSNGQLMDNDRILKQIPVDSIFSIFSIADSIKTSYIAPSNTYQFVNIISDSDSVYCSWQYGDQLIEEKITILYNQLMKLL